MVCIYCGGSTQVSNSRPQKRTNSIWRRRLCLACGQVFTSIEQADMATGVTVVHNGAFTGFDRDTLFLSIYESLKHRSCAANDAQALTRTIIGHLLRSSSNGALTREQIITETSQTLQRFDPAAATMYRAYHRI